MNFVILLQEEYEGFRFVKHFYFSQREINYAFQGINMYLYPKTFPTVGEIVIVVATSSGESGIECELPEYGNRLAFLPLGEITKRRSHIVSREIKVGKPKVCEVINVDQAKGYIDLSKKNINSEIESEKNLEYKRAKTVHTFVTSSKLDYETIIHPLYRDGLCPHELLTDGFDTFQEEVSRFVDNVDLSHCLSIYNKYYAKKMEKDVFYIKVSSPERGIDAIKEVLTLGVREGLKITLVSSPEYMVVSDLAQSRTEEILEKMKTFAMSNGVAFETRFVGFRGEK